MDDDMDDDRDDDMDELGDRGPTTDGRRSILLMRKEFLILI